MTREDTLAILSVLKAAYPSFYKGMTKADADGVVSLWAEMFRDDPTEVVALAVKAHIASDKTGFPPHIGAIKEAIIKIVQPKQMTEAEAWNLVHRAISNGIYGAREEFDKLPPILQKLVGSPNQLRDWATMDSDTVNSVIASNFQRSYKVRAANEREQMALPGDVRRVMQQLSSGMAMPALPDERRHQ